MRYQIAPTSLLPHHDAPPAPYAYKTVFAAVAPVLTSESTVRSGLFMTSRS